VVGVRVMGGARHQAGWKAWDLAVELTYFVLGEFMLAQVFNFDLATVPSGNSVLVLELGSDRAVV